MSWERMWKEAANVFGVKKKIIIIIIIIPGCSILSKNEYVMRHDRLGAHLHFSIYKTPGIETT
jgi:hypothetical protein